MSARHLRTSEDPTSLSRVEETSVLVVPCCCFVTNNNGHHSLTHTCIQSCSSHTRHALTHALRVIHSRTRSSLSLSQHHMHVTTMMFHSVHYCSLDNATIPFNINVNSGATMKEYSTNLARLHPSHTHTPMDTVHVITVLTTRRLGEPWHSFYFSKGYKYMYLLSLITGSSPVVESVLRPHRNR